MTANFSKRCQFDQYGFQTNQLHWAKARIPDDLQTVATHAPIISGFRNPDFPLRAADRMSAVGVLILAGMTSRDGFTNLMQRGMDFANTAKRAGFI